MTHKVYGTTDLGPGDGGKGGVVHKLASFVRAHTVLKRGGAQGSHGVATSGGRRFAFSQWGCGTFEGIRTHVTSHFVAHPEALLKEARGLREAGLGEDPFGLLTIDGHALCATQYHGISSRLKEMARGRNLRGTIGTGVGEADRYSLSHPELSLFARDLSRTDLRDRLAAVRRQIALDLQPVIDGEFLDEDREEVAEQIALLRDDQFLAYLVSRHEEAARFATIVDQGYLGQVILRREGVAVVETSHGVLTDRYAGFHPHTSAIRTLPRFTRHMLEEAGFQGRLVNIGIHRAYTIRHGAGPMPTADPSMAEQLLPGSHKEMNRYQGRVRVGSLDLPLLRYAIAASGGPSAYDGLAMTWFDQVNVNHEWTICNRYKAGTEDPTYFTPEGELQVRQGEDEEQLRFQHQLGHRVRDCVPEVEVRRIPRDATKEQLYELCAAPLRERLGIPVRFVSLGPTEADKIIR